MMTMMKKLIAGSAVLASFAMPIATTLAAEYPERQLTAIVPFAAGSSNDIMDASAWVAFIPSGRVRALAVSGDKRLSVLPEVPTTQEAGLPEYIAGTMFGVYTKAGAPVNTVRRLNAEINKIITSPEVAKSLNQVGLEPNPKSVEEFTQQYKNDLAGWKDLVTRAKIPMTE